MGEVAETGDKVRVVIDDGVLDVEVDGLPAEVDDDRGHKDVSHGHGETRWGQGARDDIPPLEQVIDKWSLEDLLNV